MTSSMSVAVLLYQIEKCCRQWTLGADGSNHYTFTGHGLTGVENDPTLYLMRGQKYKFINNMGDIHLGFNQLQMVQKGTI